MGMPSTSVKLALLGRHILLVGTVEIEDGAQIFKGLLHEHVEAELLQSRNLILFHVSSRKHVRADMFP